MNTFIKPIKVLGLKIGTSIANLKYAFISTDGIDIYQTYQTGVLTLPPLLKTKIHLVLGKDIQSPDDKLLIETVENDVTAYFKETLSYILPLLVEKPDLIGIEGPNIAIDAKKCYTYQLGKAKQLFDLFKIPVVSHFHNADLLNGGRGSPITTTYYNALALRLEKPALFIHIGGVSALHGIGPLGQMISFDCAPGNALLNDFTEKHARLAMDYNGKLAATGCPDLKIIDTLMRHPFFSKCPPKSIDRNFFQDKSEHFEGLGLEDGAATITLFIATAIARAAHDFLPTLPRLSYVCGSGAENPTLVHMLKNTLKEYNIPLNNTKDLNINDASAIAFLSARRYYSLPITFPATTGVSAPITGGKIYNGEEK